jgi:hypothetical protein
MSSRLIKKFKKMFMRMGVFAPCLQSLLGENEERDIEREFCCCIWSKTSIIHEETLIVQRYPFVYKEVAYIQRNSAVNIVYDSDPV